MRSYAEEQRQRHERDRMADQNPTGLFPGQHRSVLRLTEPAGPEPPPGPSGQQPDKPLP
ncbi:hypothetical protein [Streptomyces bacillaris]